MPSWEWVWHFAWLAASYAFLGWVLRAARDWLEGGEPAGLAAGQPPAGIERVTPPVAGEVKEEAVSLVFRIVRGQLELPEAETTGKSGETVVVPVHHGEALVGRGSGNDVRVFDPYVSARHLRLLVTTGRVTVEDLGSRNGTWINGRRLGEPAVLEPGDEIRLGETRLRWLGWSD
ncbi:MAG TPA: FHA domain-containing protein [Firmicutes bacterium]|nr:FHA domain-containing protein [Bacillota bacterium]